MRLSRKIILVFAIYVTPGQILKTGELIDVVRLN